MATEAKEVILKGEHLDLSFGGLKALIDVSFEVKKGEIFAMIGPNGAGKTCIANIISGYYRPQKGEMYFEGKPLTKLPRHEVPKLGIGRTFQCIELFVGMSAQDNLMAARHPRVKYGWFESMLYYGKAHREEIMHRRRVEEIIDFLEMEPIRKVVTGMLPYGSRKKVEMGRALCTEPRLLILDEPMAGMNLDEKEDMCKYIVDCVDALGITVFIIEHDMGVVMDMADKIVVLDFGRKIAEGVPAEIKKDPVVIKAYLGEE